MSFNAIRENKILAKISGFTVYIVTRNKVSGAGPYLLHVLCSNFQMMS